MKQVISLKKLLDGFDITSLLLLSSFSSDKPMQVTYTEASFCDSLRLVYLLLY